MLDRERKRVPDHKSDALKESPPGSSCPSQEHGRSEYPRQSEENERESRDEATQRRVCRSCTRDNVEAGESYFVSNPDTDWQQASAAREQELRRKEIGFLCPATQDGHIRAKGIHQNYATCIKRLHRYGSRRTIHKVSLPTTEASKLDWIIEQSAWLDLFCHVT